MRSDDTRKKLENITRGIVLEGEEDNCTAVRNLLCASFRTSTTVKKDFEGQSIVKKEQAELLKSCSAWWGRDATWLEFFKSLVIHNLLFQDTAYTFLGFTEKNNSLRSDNLFFIDTVFYTVARDEYKVE